ncbi:hypothetical protein [Candidatus Accumulibacter sp. ACC003]|nr:hypothetical protein [Candidatus Accumulibacter sp. ACC003]
MVATTTMASGVDWLARGGNRPAISAAQLAGPVVKGNGKGSSRRLAA